MNFILPKLMDLYKQHGYSIRTSLNPFHYFCSPQKAYENALIYPFTAFYTKNQNLFATGGGISLLEIYFFENLFSGYHPKNIFIIGNASGWSTIALSLLNPGSKVTTIDAGTEGADNMAGIDLTNKIIDEEKLNAKVVYGFSPQDTKKIIEENFDEKPDFVFIDGLHTNEQLLLDYYETAKYTDKNCVWVMHDVINWKMGTAYEKIAKESGLNAKILHRTTSGMAVLYNNEAPRHITKIAEVFSESEDTLKTLPKVIYTEEQIESIKNIEKFRLFGKIQQDNKITLFIFGIKFTYKQKGV